MLDPPITKEECERHIKVRLRNGKVVTLLEFDADDPYGRPVRIEAGWHRVGGNWRADCVECERDIVARVEEEPAPESADRQSEAQATLREERRFQAAMRFYAALLANPNLTDIIERGGVCGFGTRDASAAVQLADRLLAALDAQGETQ